MKKGKSIKVDNDGNLGQNIDSDIVLEEDTFEVSDKLKKVQKQLKVCEKERQEYLNGWQRARADAINKAKESVLERERTVFHTQDEIFIELFPILDSFDMAFSDKETWEKIDKNWRVGIENIHAQATQIFERAGISVIETNGIFDFHLHEQVQTESVKNKKDDGQILTVIQKGYQRGSKILRPAKVIIGKFN